MAHGFLTPTPVSGDNFWSNVQDLWKKLQELKKKKAPPEEVVPAVVSELQNALPPGRQKLLSSGKQQSVDKPKALNMLSGSPVTKMLGSGKSEITIKQQPQLPAGGLSSSKGGTFTNLPGISSAPKKLDTDAFFKAAQTGVHPETGQYLNSDERKEYLKKSKTTMNAPASVAAGGINSASSIGEVTRGDEEIVSSVEDLTKVVVSLVSAVKAQTAAQLKAATAQKASTERTANRALAAAEESSLEQSSDLSGSITPTYGTNSGALMPSGAGSGGGGASGGLMGGKAAQAITKRGLGRALPRLGASVAGKAGARAGAQATAKIGTNVAAKTGGKALARMIPGVQTALGVGFAMDSFSKGDVLGGLLNLGSAIPGPLGWAFLGGSVAKDLSGGSSTEVAPFAQGGIISSPTLSMMGEGNKKEGVFPLQGREGKKTFEMFGQGMIDAQKKNSRDFAAIQAKGLRQYYENEDGFKKMGEIFGKIFEGLKGILSGLLTPEAKAREFNPAEDYLADPTVSGDEKEYLMRLMIAEAGGQGDVGMAAVGRSVLNRAGLIQSGKVGAGQFNAKSGSIMDVINASGQYQPVEQGKLKRNLSADERKRAEAALAIAMNQGDMRGRLEAKGLKSDQVNKLMAATGFRAGSAFNDPSQNVNVTKLGDHYFNTAGNKGLLTPGSVKMNDGGPQLGGFGRAMFGETGNVSNAKNWVHGHFQTNTGTAQDLVNDTAPVVAQLLKSGTKVELGNGKKFSPGMSMSDIKDTIKKGISLHTHSGDGRSVDIFVPKGTRVPFPLSDVKTTKGNEGRSGVLPGSGKVWVGHLTANSQSGGIVHKPEGETKQSVASKPASRGGGISPIFQPANANTGTGMMATSAQVQMGAMGLSAVGGGNITNIYNSNGQQVSPIGNTLSAGTPSGNAGLSWMALIRR